MNNDLFGYLISNDMLNDTLGIKNILNCPNCNNELYIYENNLLYCKKCKCLFEYNDYKKLDNKVLSYKEKKNMQ